MARYLGGGVDIDRKGEDMKNHAPATYEVEYLNNSSAAPPVGKFETKYHWPLEFTSTSKDLQIKWEVACELPYCDPTQDKRERSKHICYVMSEAPT